MTQKPTNEKLYNQVKKEAKQRFDAWPSAYASGWLVQEYKRRGGKFRGSKPRSTGLTRWYAEEWIDVCELPRKVSCGRQRSDVRKYPYCRPSKQITKNTPKLASNLSKSQRQKICSRKRKSPEKRIFQ
jgi:hypothetical protein